MSNITHGMNVEQVKDLARKLNEKSAQIDQILSEVSSALQGTGWVGPDAQSFRDKWEGEGKQQMGRAKAILDQASQAATRNAADQDSTSNASSGNF